MCGAGISVSAGIPDFRTPGTGLYSQLEKYNLPKPEAVFEIDYFRNNPRPFHLLAKELFPGHYCPTPTHVFMRLLHDKGLLLRVFTQNIDSLEHVAGLPTDKVVAAHGNFDSAHCIACGEEHDVEYVRKAVMGGEICRCSVCSGLVKPDIVFFGESLPERFFESYQRDFPSGDLLLVMGTSLVVQPFASLVDMVEDDCPRLLINRERVGEERGGTAALIAAMLGLGGDGGFTFPPEDYYADEAEAAESAAAGSARDINGGVREGGEEGSSSSGGAGGTSAEGATALSTGTLVASTGNNVAAVAAGTPLGAAEASTSAAAGAARSAAVHVCCCKQSTSIHSKGSA